MTAIAQLMSRDPITLHPQDSLQHAAQLMDEFNIGALPVCEGEALMGIVTDRDITVRATAAGLDPTRTTVDTVMSTRVRSCTQHESVHHVLQQMATVQIRRMPVLDDNERVVGMVSLGDLAARLPAGVEETLGRISTPAEPDRARLAA
jgi:CBS domain-containing protein